MTIHRHGTAVLRVGPKLAHQCSDREVTGFEVPTSARLGSIGPVHGVQVFEHQTVIVARKR